MKIRGNTLFINLLDVSVRRDFGALNAFNTGNPFFYKFTTWYIGGIRVSKGVNAFTTGNPFFTNLLEVSIGRDLGALNVSSFVFPHSFAGG